MSFLTEINKKNKQPDAEEIASKMADKFTIQKEKGVKSPVDKTADLILNIIKDEDDPDRIRDILTAVLKEKNLPDSIFNKTAAEVTKMPDIPNSVVTDVTDNNDVSDESIKQILNEGELNVKERRKLISNIVGKKTNNELVLDELEDLYKKTGKMEDNDVIALIRKNEELLMGKPDEEIKKQIQKIIAKKMAENFYDDKKKGTMLYSFTEILPTEEMLDIDLPELVGQEYKKIESLKHKEKKNRFDKESFKEQILNEMAKEIISKYDKTGDIVIPHSKRLKELSEGDKEKFLNKIENLSVNEINENDVRNMRMQINGENFEKKKLETIRLLGDSKWVEQLCFLPKEESEKEIAMHGELSKLVEQLCSMPKEESKKVIETFEKTLGKRIDSINKAEDKETEVKVTKDEETLDEKTTDEKQKKIGQTDRDDA